MDAYVHMHASVYVYAYAYAYIYITLWGHMVLYDTICPTIWLHIAHLDSSGAIWHHRGTHMPAWPNMAPYGQRGHIWAQHDPIWHHMAPFGTIWSIWPILHSDGVPPHGPKWPHDLAPQGYIRHHMAPYWLIKRRITCVRLCMYVFLYIIYIHI